MTTSANYPPAGAYSPSRVTLYHVAVSEIDKAFGPAGGRSKVQDVLVDGMRELLPLDASEAAFDEQHAKVRAVERANGGDGTLSIPFEAAISTVGNPCAVQCATVKALMLYVEWMMLKLPPPRPPRPFDGFGAYGSEIDDVRHRTAGIDERPSSWLLPMIRLASPTSVRAPLVRREMLVQRETRINAPHERIDARPNPAPDALLDSEWHLITIGQWPLPFPPIPMDVSANRSPLPTTWRVYDEGLDRIGGWRTPFAHGYWLSDVICDGTPRLERPIRIWIDDVD
jgi:hypothetical protein